MNFIVRLLNFSCPNFSILQLNSHFKVRNSQPARLSPAIYQTARQFIPKQVLKKRVFLLSLSLGPEGFEPTTKGLWVPCATAAPQARDDFFAIWFSIYSAWACVSAVRYPSRPLRKIINLSRRVLATGPWRFIRYLILTNKQIFSS